MSKSKPARGEFRSPIDLMMEAYSGHWSEIPVFAPDIRAVCRSIHPEGTITVIEEAGAHFRLILDLPERATLIDESGISVVAHVRIRLPTALALSAVGVIQNGATLNEAWAAEILKGSWWQTDRGEEAQDASTPTSIDA